VSKGCPRVLTGCISKTAQNKLLLAVLLSKLSTESLFPRKQIRVALTCSCLTLAKKCAGVDFGDHPTVFHAGPDRRSHRQAVATVSTGVLIYVGVDLALVVDVLPNPDDSGKDLGVFNMADAMPQTVAPALGGVLLAIGSATHKNYDLLLWVAGIACIVGALVVLPIKSVR
jgi:hypothetical protein